MKYSKNSSVANGIRERLTEAIRTSGKKQIEIAERACIADTTLSDYIHKSTLPSIETFALLCKALDVSADYILGLDED